MDPKTNKALQLFLSSATGFLAITVIILLVWVVSVYQSASSNRSFQDTVEVRGTASVPAVPDVARISFGHRTEDRELKVAQANLEEVMAGALASLKDFGIEDKDINQQGYNAYPRYEYKANCTGIYCMDGNRELVAYEVSQTIEVTIRDIETTGEVVGLLGGSGVTELSGPFFEIEDPSQYQQEARALAIENARKEAKVLAKSLGVRLGKMVDFYENSYGYPMPYMSMRMDGAEGDTAVMEESAQKISIPVGEDEISVDVTLVFKVR